MDTPVHMLNTGAKIPGLGLGTWQSKPGEVVDAVRFALQHGYRHIDAAWSYGNETEVGKGIADSGVPRDEVFVTTKLWSTYHTNVEKGLDESLQKLGLDYVDLFLIHWPVPLNSAGNDLKFPRTPAGTLDILHDWDVEKMTWKQMEAAYRSGKARAIGVSNMSQEKLEKLLKTAEVAPAVNQVEMHVYLQSLLEYCKVKGIIVEAFSPLGSSNSPILQDQGVVRIARKHSVEASTVALSWLACMGVIPLPKSVRPERLMSNFKLIPLDEDDLSVLAGLHRTKQRRFLKAPWDGYRMGFEDWEYAGEKPAS